MTSATLTVLLTHQDSERVAQMIARWRGFAERLLLIHAGNREDFEKTEFSPKLFLDDPRIRTGHHQRERQSYTGLYRISASAQAAEGARFLFLAEYDHYPVAVDLLQQLETRIEQERAGLLAHHLRRVDRTNDPHYLHHASDGWFHEWYARRSRRADRSEILMMFGSGAFWRLDVLQETLAEGEPPGAVYHELHFATLAHHLGFRVRGLRDQDPYVQVGVEWNPSHPPRGAWALHPVKKAWG